MVGAFDIVGSVLVVALMIAPPAAAYLLTDRLPRLIGLSVLIGAGSALGGYWLAYGLDASISGSMATVSGLLFGAAFLFAPERGILALSRRQRRQRIEFAMTMLAVHLLNHEDSIDALEESRLEHLGEHLRWQPAFAGQVVHLSQKSGWVDLHGSQLSLTPLGREKAREQV